MRSNMFMMMMVMKELPPLQQGYIRCAGSIGFNTFEEVVAYGLGDLVPVVAEYNGQYNTNNNTWKFPHHYPLAISLHVDTQPLPPTTTTSKILPHRLSITISESAILQQLAPHFSQSLIFVMEGRWGVRESMEGYSLTYINDRTTPQWVVGVDGDESVVATPVDLLMKSAATKVDLVGFEDTTIISDGFLKSCKFLSQNTSNYATPTWGGSALTKVTDTAKWCVSRVRDMKQQTTPTDNTASSSSPSSSSLPPTLLLSPFSNVSHIGSNFLGGCTSITYIDLTPFSKVVSMGDGFMGSCTKLKTVDFTPMANSLITIGEWLLYDCSSVESVNLSGLRNITTVSRGFLGGCRKLKNIDLSPLSNVTSIKCLFLGNCSSLKSIDLSPFTNVTELGTYFLFACSSLRNGLDLAPLCNVVSIGTFFLFNTYPSPMRGKIVNADMMMESLDVESKRNVQFLENTVSSR